MNRTILLTGIALGALAIALGAFGAHGLEKFVDREAVETFDTGVTYQMYHALLIVILGGMKPIPAPKKKWIFISLLIGVLFFSFSIYFLATNTMTDFDFRVIGFITPIGGLLLIIGWCLLGYQCWRNFGAFDLASRDR